MGGVEDGPGQVGQAGVVEAVQDLLVQPAPHPGTRPDQEPTVRGGLRYPETGRQGPPGASGYQDVDGRGEQRLIRRVLPPATLRPHPGRREQRLRDLPQPVRNNPTPRTPPHDLPNGRLTT